MHGDYDDSAGLRYIIPELYFRIRDYKGALVYFRWFSKAFPDDIGSHTLPYDLYIESPDGTISKYLKVFQLYLRIQKILVTII